MKTEKEIIENANRLAMKFTDLLGFELADETNCMLPDKTRKYCRFDLSENPQVRRMWELACIAYDFIEGTNPENAVDEVEWDLPVSPDVEADAENSCSICRSDAYVANYCFLCGRETRK